MATGRLTEIIKARRESGLGVTSSLAGSVKERLKEKFDPRRLFNQNGILTALFPKLRSYRANISGQKSSGDVLNQPSPSSDSLSATNPLFQSINTSTKIIAKNSMVLPLIQKDTNLMKQTLKKIVKAMQVKKKLVSATRTMPVPVRNVPVTEARVLETEREEPEKDKGPLVLLAAMIMETFNEIRKAITKTLTELPGKIVSGIVSGIKGLFTATKIASSVLLSILRPLLGLIFSPAGFALLLAAGVFYSLYKFSNFLSKKVAEEVPNMNVLTPKEASAALTSSSRDLIAFASKAAGRKTPFTLEESVAYLEDQVKNGKKIAEEGSNLIVEKSRLESILKSGDKSKIEAEGGVDAIEGKISNLKIRIQNLGGEEKIKKIISEGPAELPPLEKREYSTELQRPKTGTQAYENRISGITRRKNEELLGHFDTEDASSGKIIRDNAAIVNTEKMNQEGYGKQSATSPLKDPFKSPNIAAPSSSGDINFSLSNSSVDAQDGTDNSPNIVNTPKPVRDMSIDKKDIDLAQYLNDMNEYLSREGVPYRDVDSGAFATYMNVRRINSPLNDSHPDIVKALKIKMHEINSMIAY